MPNSRRPWRIPTTSLTPPTKALAALAILILSFTGCAPADPTPSPSPPGPSTPTVQPTPITTTISGPPSGPTTVPSTPGIQPTQTTTITVSPTNGPTSSPVPTSTSTAPRGPGWTFVVVRHANRDKGNDPPLTEAGEIRARRLGDQLSTHAGVAVYATNDRRTRATARPTAVVWEVPISIYKSGLAPAALVAQIKQQHPGGEILIVGDSDTVPGIVGELCRCKVGPIPENDHANRFIVVLSSDSSLIRMEHQIAY